MIEWMTSGILLLVCWFMPWNSHPYPSLFLTNVSTCDIEVDAGPDTNVCFPGGTLTLLGSVTGNSLFTQWSPSTGLNNPFILHPVANITGPITYTLTGWSIDPDNTSLITNGNFNLGNTGFVSDYVYMADLPGVQDELVAEGTYTVVNNPNLVHDGFNTCNDHTGGGGNMMVVNGAGTLQNIWCETIAVSPNTWYNVSAWLASVSQGSPAMLRFSINGTQIGSIVNAPISPCIWVPFNASWNSGVNVSATICIVNLNTAFGGNDFALDDIAFVPMCSVEDEVNITLYEEEAPEPHIQGPAFLCAGDIGVYSSDFPDDPVIFSFQWSIPPGATILSGQGTPEVTILWNEAQEAEICLHIETRCEENESCYEITIADVPETPLISGSSDLCPGDIATFYTPEQDPDDVYQWTIPPLLTVISGGGTNEIEVMWANAGEAEICLEITNACGSTDNCSFITLSPGYLITFDTVICTGTTIVINGTTYGNGVWTGEEHFSSIDGCDSIVQINVSEASTLTFMITENLCEGDSIFLQGAFQTDAGIFTDSFTTLSGCDSLVITELIFSKPDTTWNTSTTCDPAQTGSTIMTFQTGPCDSVVVTQVLLASTDTTIISMTSCLPADTGQIQQVLTNISGCDSIIIFITTLLPTDTTLFYNTSCDPAQAGTTTQSFTNIHGCDSLVITTIAFNLSDTTLISLLTCTYADTGITTSLLTNILGCDSLVITHTMYAGSDTTFLSSNTCNPSDSGLVIIQLTNQFGCDSVVSTFTTFIPSDLTYINIETCDPGEVMTEGLVFLNVGGCDSTVIFNVFLGPPDHCTLDASFFMEQPQCFGDTAILNIDIQTGQGPLILIVQNGGDIFTYNFVSSGAYSIELSDLQGEVILTLQSANGLELIDTVFAEFPFPLEVDAIVANEYNGFGVPCFGDDIGKASLTDLAGGTPPIVLQWSTGDHANEINNLKAGMYWITATDQNGCMASDSVTVTEPLLMQYELNIQDVSCFDKADGLISISEIEGGVNPWLTSLDNAPFQPGLSFIGLTAGIHKLLIKDQNDCEVEEQVIITEPDDWSVDLGPDTSLAFGSTFNLSVSITGQPEGALEIIWSDEQCENCLSRTIEAGANNSYSLIATDENGCVKEDEIRFTIKTDRDIYFPNIFSPNADNINDQFIITAGTLIEEIEELSIYDRWGNKVFSKFKLLPGDPNLSWDGLMNGKALNPGVYVFKVFVKYKDGVREMKIGDVTLMR